MKKLLLFLSIAICGTANAQITITQSDIPVVGTVAMDVNDSVVTTSPGSAGANQTWNLTTLKNHTIDTITFITPASSPYASMFPAANIATLQMPNNINTFYYADGSGAKIVGLAFPFFSGPYVGRNIPPYRFMTFPATYGTSIIDSTIGTASFAFPIPPDDSMKVVSHMHYTETIDGWGTVTTPAGSFPCLRDIAIRNHTDSTFTRNSSTGLWSLYNAPSTKRDTFYFWYGNNQAFLVAEIQIQESLPKQGFYLLSSAVGMQEANLNSETTVSPNPSNGIFTITTEKNISEIEIRNILGEKVYSAYRNCDKAEMDLSNQAKGIYFYRLSCGNKIIGTGKIIIE